MVIVAYDVRTADVAGQARLRKVADACSDYGRRVQSSVFECLLYPEDYMELKRRLERIIDTEKDSVKFYKLGEKLEERVEFIGIKRGVNRSEDIFI